MITSQNLDHGQRDIIITLMAFEDYHHRLEVKLLLSEFNKHIIEYNIHTEGQGGFRKDYSSFAALRSFTRDISRATDKAG